MPSKDITLYAKWTINQYTISFKSNGGTVVSPITTDFNNQVLQPNHPLKAGYDFEGWYSDMDLTNKYTFTTMPSNNIALYAKWTTNQYTISFYTDGGSDVSPITADYNSNVTAPTEPTKDGYTFNGWYCNNDLTDKYIFTTMPSQSITLYAKWSLNQYTISFNSNGGSVVIPITDKYSSYVTEPTAPTKEGYTFEGWYSDTELTNKYTFTTMPSKNITLYANWIMIPTAIIQNIFFNNGINIQNNLFYDGTIYFDLFVNDRDLSISDLKIDLLQDNKVISEISNLNNHYSNLEFNDLSQNTNYKIEVIVDYHDGIDYENVILYSYDFTTIKWPYGPMDNPSLNNGIITFDITLNDSNYYLTSSSIELYNGNTKIQDLSIEDFNNTKGLSFINLDMNTDYKIKLILNYKNGANIYYYYFTTGTWTV